MRCVSAGLLASTLLLAVACTHTVVIDSDPTGAEIKVNGEKVGTAPVSYNESTGWEKMYDVEATKPGFKSTRKQLRQTEWNIPVTIASGGCRPAGNAPDGRGHPAPGRAVLGPPAPRSRRGADGQGPWRRRSRGRGAAVLVRLLGLVDERVTL